MSKLGSRVTRRVGALVALTLLLASCAANEQVEPRVRNSAVECFVDDFSRQDALDAKQLELDSARESERETQQTALAELAQRPLCDEVAAVGIANETGAVNESDGDIPGQAEADDIKQPSCDLSIERAGLQLRVEFCAEVTRVELADPDSGWEATADSNTVVTEAAVDLATIDYVAWVGAEILVSGTADLVDGEQKVAVPLAASGAAAVAIDSTQTVTVAAEGETFLVGIPIVVNVDTTCETLSKDDWWKVSLVSLVNGREYVDDVQFGARVEVVPRFPGEHRISARNKCVTTGLPVEGSATVTVAAGGQSSNDGFASPYALTGLRGSASIATGGATSEEGEPSHGCGGPYASTWYEFTADIGGRLRLSSAKSGYRARLAPYLGDELATLAQKSATRPSSDAIVVQLTAGEKLRIAADGCGVAGRRGERGRLTLEWEFQPETALASTSTAVSAAATVVALESGVLGALEIVQGTSMIIFDQDDRTQVVRALGAEDGDVYLRSSVQDWTELRRDTNSTQLTIADADTLVEIRVRLADESTRELALALERTSLISLERQATESPSGDGASNNLLVLALLTFLAIAAGVVMLRNRRWLKPAATVVAVSVAAGIFVVVRTESPALAAESVATTLHPAVDGFAFPNFTSKLTAETFDVNDLVTMFGAAACVDEIADPCTPTAEAAAWARMVNQARSSGHCEGLVVQAAVRFGTEITPKTVDLPNEGEVTHALFRSFATQFLPEAQDDAAAWAKRSLREIVAALAESFKSGRTDYTMGLYTDKGGHSVLPFAVEYRGANLAVVHVYDSNWPGKNRYVEIDLARQSWAFSFAGVNPATDPSPWTGGRGDMDLTSLTARATATCPFCTTDATVRNTMLVIKSTDAEWSISTEKGSYSPTSPNDLDGVRATPLRGSVSDDGAREYVITLPESDDIQLRLPGQASAFVVTPNGITQVVTESTDNAPVRIRSDQVEVNDPNVTLTVARGNLVVSTTGANNVITLADETIAATVQTASGVILDVVASAETPQVVARAVSSGSGSVEAVVSTQSANNETITRELQTNGTETSTASTGTIGLNTVVAELPPALVSPVVRPGLIPVEARSLANPLNRPDAPYVPPTGVIVANTLGTRPCDLPGFPTGWIIQPGAATCTAPVVSVSTRSAADEGASCTEGGVTGVWVRAGPGGSLVCRLSTATNPVATTSTATSATNATNRAGGACTLPGFPATWIFSPSGTSCIAPVVSTVVVKSPGAACSENGVTGTWVYASGTANLVCASRQTTTAAAATPTTLQSCSSQGYPATWVLGANGVCTAPVFATTATATSSCISRGFPATFVLTVSGDCIAPTITVATPTSGATIGTACSENGVPGTWGYLGGTATIGCIPRPGTTLTATSTLSCVAQGFPATWVQTASGACVAPLVASTVIATPGSTTTTTGTTTGPVIGTGCSQNGVPGTWGYVGGTATIGCISNTTATTASTTRSCSEDGFPATWTRTASGSCIAPVVTGTIGTACSQNGVPGTWGYVNNSATIGCIPLSTATTAPSTATTTATTTRSCSEDGFPATWIRTSNGSCIAPVVTGTIGTACSENGVPGTWGYLNNSATIGCIPLSTATTAPATATTAPSTATTVTPTIGSACSVNGVTGTWGYSGVNIVCITTTTTTAPATATTSTTVTPTIGSACSVNGVTGTWGYSGANIVCITTTTTTAPTTTAPTTTTEPWVVGSWAYNTDPPACSYNGGPCGWYRGDTRGTYVLGPPGP